MSGGKLRKEKDCLNCGHHVEERFCPFCGQENLEPKENFFQLFFHTFADITHFDSKFFTTLKYLFFHPGRLTIEYNMGRRMRFVHPIKLFVFTSFLFFLGLGIFQNPHQIVDKINEQINTTDTTKMDTVIQISPKGIDTIYKDSSNQNFINFSLDTTSSFENSALPKRFEHINEAYKKDKVGFWKNALSTFIHNAHYFIFIFIPILASFYFVVYWRRKFFYSEHIIFAIHFHVIILIILLINMILGKILHQSVFGYLFIGIILYQFLSMKKVYQQGYGKTLLKLLLIDFIYFILLILMLTALFIYSALTQH